MFLLNVTAQQENENVAGTTLTACKMLFLKPERKQQSYRFQYTQYSKVSAYGTRIP